jgi:hypothetical protein
MRWRWEAEDVVVIPESGSMREWRAGFVVVYNKSSKSQQHGIVYSRHAQ